MSTAHEFDDELLSAYLDNEVTAAERALVEERLRTDERARQVLDDLRTASEAVKLLRPRLSRDLTAAVLAEIERQDPAIDRARVLTIPVREGDATSSSGSSGSRGLIWAGLAVAAALLLMVLRTEDQAPRGRRVASSEKEIAGSDGEGAAIQSDPRSGERERDPSGQLADSSKAREPNRDAQRSLTEDRDIEPSRGIAESPDRGPQSPPPADAGAEVAEEPTAAVAGAIETVRVEVAGDDVDAAFTMALASAGIELLNDELPADLAADLAEVLSGDATDANESANAYLVEATSAQLEAVATALQQRDQSAARAAEATTAAPAAEDDGDARRGRAWRTAVRAQMVETAEGAAAAASGPAEFRGGAGDDEADATSVKRVLFLLRRAQ
jgi:hypothetical protein